MESVLAPLVDVAPEMFVAKPTVQAYFKHEVQSDAAAVLDCE